jgi:DNA helicase-2/ATP-dependent DNA helicase PcrA
VKKQRTPALILADLNPAQTEAVLHGSGPLFVLAGAGSGKTRVITHRIAHLLEKGVPPDSILAITFTNKAAGEMKARAEQLCGMESRWISTFHSFCARILRRHIHRLPPYDNAFSIYDTDDVKTVLKDILKEMCISSSVWNSSAAQAAISQLKNSGEAVEEGTFAMARTRDRQLGEIFEEYVRRLEQRNAVDFDDLLLLTVRLFDKAPDVLERYREQFQHVLVDEYQDINALQYRIGQVLTATHRNICITGDPDQSIYAWRGADISNILNFQNDYPDARLVTLDKNYRSTGHILEVANSLIERNTERVPKSLWTEGPPGDPVRVHRFAEEGTEASGVATRIQDLLLEGFSPGDIAVFYRINALSRPVEQALIYSNIPYDIVGGIEFFLRREIKDILAYLRILDNPRDTGSLRRIINVPSRGIGKVTLGKLQAAAADQRRSPLELILDDDAGFPGTRKTRDALLQFRDLYRHLAGTAKLPVAERVREVIQRTGYEEQLRESGDPADRDRLENLGELVNAAEEYDLTCPGGPLTGFLEQVNLLGDVDRWERDTDRVALMSLHSAKGLEFPAVFIIGVEDGILPLIRDSGSTAEVEEERRLLYVGITRARTRLCLTHTCTRRRFGRTQRSLPSRFLRELQPPEGADGTDAATGIVIEGATAAGIQERGGQAAEWSDRLAAGEEDPPDDGYDDTFDQIDEDPFPVGTEVYHEEYGGGRVIRTSGIGRRWTVTIVFEEGRELQFNPNYAPLRRVR